VRQHDRRSVCDRMRMSGSGSCVEDLPGAHAGRRQSGTAGYVTVVEHYPERSGNASGNMDGENVCPTVNPTRYAVCSRTTSSSV
jgi:hypothetical protein